MDKVRILNADRMGGALKILRAYRQGNDARFWLERLPLFVPGIACMIPEIVLIAMLDIDILQRAIKRCVEEIHPLSLALCTIDSREDARLHFLANQLDLMIPCLKRNMPARRVTQVRLHP